METVKSPALDLVNAWAQEYRRYLLDGDPRILHPIARDALVSAIVEYANAAAVETPARPKVRKKADG